MNKKICVYTCITGNYDNLHEIKNPEKNIDYYCFTNNKKLKSKTWKIVYVQDNNLDNCRLARKIKILGHPIINKYDITVWNDADVIWQKNISEFVDKYFKNTNFAIFSHHARKNIYDEAIICLRLRKDTKENIIKILDFYKSINYPDDNGLCESTVFIKNPKDPQVTKTMQIWFDMIKKYSRRDQLSFNYAVWKTNLKVNYISLNVWDNPWFDTTKHTTSQKIKECHVYYGNPDKNFDINKYFVYGYHCNNNIYTFNTIIPNDTNEIEFNPTDIIGVNYSDIFITPTPKSIVIHGTTLSISCNNHSIICANGNFKKNQKLNFSITINTPTPSELNKLIEYQWIENNHLETKNLQLKDQIEQLKNKNNELQSNLHDIIHSKGWQTLEKIRKILHP